MKKFVERLGEIAKVAGLRLVEKFKREPATVRLAVMGLVAALGAFTPEQLAGLELFIDRVTLPLLILLGADLRGKVTPAKKPVVGVPVGVPAALPRGSSGAF